MDAPLRRATPRHAAPRRAWPRPLRLFINYLNSQTAKNYWLTLQVLNPKPITAQSIWTEIYLKRYWKDFFLYNTRFSALKNA